MQNKTKNLNKTKQKSFLFFFLFFSTQLCCLDVKGEDSKLLSRTPEPTPKLSPHWHAVLLLFNFFSYTEPKRFISPGILQVHKWNPYSKILQTKAGPFVLLKVFYGVSGYFPQGGQSTEINSKYAFSVQLIY